jgi:DNA-directed RNA polymerase specialized sigma24 family protein
MASWMPENERDRELLSQAIVKTLDSWPEFHRRIFSEVHYGGKSVESVAAAWAMRPAEVHALLEDCERRLRKALRILRPHTSSNIPVAPQFAA